MMANILKKFVSLYCSRRLSFSRVQPHSVKKEEKGKAVIN